MTSDNAQGDLSFELVPNDTMARIDRILSKI